MIYRKFGKKIKFKPSALGYGLMRLPMKEDNTVDVEEAVRIVRYAIDNGVNYLDTAYFYHGGESEKVMALVLKDGYREKVKIADKMPLWAVKEESDLDKYFYEQLEKLGVKKIDFYLLHALSKVSIGNIKKFNVLQWLEKKKADGLIEYFGFSFHDSFSVFKKIVDLHKWDFCMVQFNLVDKKRQATLRGIKYAHQKGMGVIVIEPLRGGQLTINVPGDIKAHWEAMALLYKDKEIRPAKYLLDWVWNFEEVSFAISGMSSFDQVIDNLASAKQAKIGRLTKKQLALFSKIQRDYLSKIVINCTKCNYCKVCPQKVPIPLIFDKINEIKRFENQKTPSFQYNFIAEEQRANKCIECKKCVDQCPQKLNIPAILRLCSRVFDQKEDFYKVFE